ncbi:inorganic triphosphatase [Bowmanella denitrificans]|uniref:CYTH domain-containing protein n=1 Tax=Bowmanella denitrificans TaxID=366582 RepID=UPI000C9C288D|nr:CYTH and CHAD domain-containing protein [Bowmanella denitrificans]
METEIELKLLVCGHPDVVKVLENQLLPTLAAHYTTVQMALSNRYYDTPDKQLRAMDMGFRVRGRDGRFQQTLKTAGQVQGGLHQRPEYNVELEDQNPDLALFDPAIFPADISIASLQSQLCPLFTTHFSRHAYHLTFSNGTELELVYDKGQVATESHQQAINEIEIELKKGDVADIFHLARKLADALPLRLGIFSKAARGYLLAAGQELTPRALPDFLGLDEQDNIEQAFLKALHYALDYWQFHQQCYLETGKPRALGGISAGIQLVSQAISLYLPMLQCDELLTLQSRLIKLNNDWYWTDSLLAVKALRSRKGPFRKRLAKSEEVISYLRGRYEGLLMQHRPDELILAPQAGRLQLELAALAVELPWRKSGEAWQSPLLEHARGWLAQGWFTISQSMPRKKKFNAQNYLSSEPLLRQTLFNGLFLAGLFSPQNRDQFRAPWLDIIDGIDELKALHLLKSELDVADVQDKEELLVWCKDKMAHLLEVMEQSRKAALKMEPYWKP